MRASILAALEIALPAGSSLRVRKDFLDLTSSERDRLAAALNTLYARGSIAERAAAHEAGWFNIHRGPVFLPWHRWFIQGLEDELRSVDEEVSLPYWDWTRPEARDLDVEPFASFFGGRQNSGGEFDHWDYQRGVAPNVNNLPSLDSVIDELQASSFVDYRELEFFGSHVPGHTWTGGTMASPRSPADPLFYLHHCMVDRLWAIWQANHTSADQYTLDDRPGYPRYPAAYVRENDLMFSGSLGAPETPAAMLDRSALGFGFPRDPRLEERASDRGLPSLTTELL